MLHEREASVEEAVEERRAEGAVPQVLLQTVQRLQQQWCNTTWTAVLT